MTGIATTHVGSLPRSAEVTELIFAAEAEARWLDHTEQRLARHPHRTMGLELSTETPKRGRPAKPETSAVEAVAT